MSKETEQFLRDFKQVTGIDWDEHPDLAFKEMALHLWSAGKEFGWGQ